MTTIAAIAPSERERVRDERAVSHLLARRERAHSSAPRARNAAPAVRTVRTALVAITIVCFGLHGWLAVAAPDWRSLAMLGLAAACAACMLHRGRTALPSTGEWGVMAVAALAMLVIHLTGAGTVGHHAAALVGGAGEAADAATGGASGALHALPLSLAALELGMAMLALVVSGVRSRSGHGRAVILSAMPVLPHDEAELKELNPT